MAAGQIERARELSKRIPVLLSPNMSSGVNLLFRIVEEVTKALPDFDIEIAEFHHRRKKDAPSGTAARIAEIVREIRSGSSLVHGREGMVGQRTDAEIGMHSLRGGDVVGEHTVVFAGEGERFELNHKAHSRLTFAMGTLRAIRFIAGKPPGFYSMSDVLGI
jgi:4-hydroxy-tetrahydrodipicolinate reductase